MGISYKNIYMGTFLERPNRFIAKVFVDGKVETVHVKNTGRCRELLINGATVYLEKSSNPLRKTQFDLVAVEKISENRTFLVNMDSQIPNAVAFEYLKNCGMFSHNAVFKREVTYKHSRFDIYVEDGYRKAFVEVKGVTLENSGVVSFPDSPTERGVKHINELCTCIDDGFEAYIFFVIQMQGAAYFTPNDSTHKAFGDALRSAAAKGVNIMCYDCTVNPDFLEINQEIKVVL